MLYGVVLGPDSYNFPAADFVHRWWIHIWRSLWEDQRFLHGYDCDHYYLPYSFIINIYDRQKIYETIY